LASKSKYIFKYNKDNSLYNYVELNKVDKVISYFKIEDKTLVRYDRSTDTKQLIKFKKPVRLEQKFMANESFITVFDVQSNQSVQHNMPEYERRITLVKNNVSLSDFGKYVIERWKQITNKELIKEKDGLTFKTIDDSITSNLGKATDFFKHQRFSLKAKT